METKKKIIIIGSSLVLAYGLALLVFWIITKINENKAYNGNDKNNNESSSSGSGSSSNNVNADVSSSDFPLRRGSDSRKDSGKNQGVWAIQNICVSMGYDPQKDGIWGKATETAVDALVNSYYMKDYVFIKKPFEEFFTKRSDANAQKAMWEISFSNYQKLCKFWRENSSELMKKNWRLDDNAHITFNN